ncbi:MAG: hypothetical protein ACKVOP_06010 [Sphingomonadaceae bacterium]
MSRILLSAVLTASGPASADPAPILEKYYEATAVAVRCVRPADSREIVVCGRRAADRWRVPLIEYAAGDPRTESVSGERNRLASEPKQSCGNTAFFGQAGCGGMVGVSTRLDLGGGSAVLRPLAD